jgi:hypothetical protein
MCTKFRAKVLEGGEVVVKGEKLSIIQGLNKTVIPLNQIESAVALPWVNDPYVLINTVSGIKLMIGVEMESKDELISIINKRGE